MHLTSYPWRILHNVPSSRWQECYLRQVREYAGFIRNRLELASDKTRSKDMLDSFGESHTALIRAASELYGLHSPLFKALLPPVWEVKSDPIPVRQRLLNAANILILATAPHPDVAALRQQFARFVAANPGVRDSFIVISASRSRKWNAC